LFGAVAGALLVNYAKTYLTGAFPEVWLYALGALFVLVTLFLPGGLAGLLPAQRRRGLRPPGSLPVRWTAAEPGISVETKAK
jgi:urea transport system permease protein